MARNRVIGADGDMPWHLPEDLAHFKRITIGKPIIMGRRTWDSIGRPLPGRTNIVVSRTLASGSLGDEVEVVSSLESALALAGASDGAEPETMVIGGGQLYAEAIDLADRLYLTEIDLEVNGDAWFPEVDLDRWREVEVQTLTATGNGPELRFITYDRV